MTKLVRTRQRLVSFFFSLRFCSKSPNLRVGANCIPKDFILVAQRVTSNVRFDRAELSWSCISACVIHQNEPRKRLFVVKAKKDTTVLRCRWWCLSIVFDGWGLNLNDFGSKSKSQFAATSFVVRCSFTSLSRPSAFLFSLVWLQQASYY